MSPRRSVLAAAITVLGLLSVPTLAPAAWAAAKGHSRPGTHAKPKAKAKAKAVGRIAYATGGVSGDNAIWIANADGTHRRRVGSGIAPLLSPNGQFVAASWLGATGHALAIYPVSGGPPRVYFDVTLLSATAASWSPDSRYLAVELYSVVSDGDPLAGLATVDLRTGAVNMVDYGEIAGASFAPRPPDRIAYARAWIGNPAGPVDIYTAAPNGTGRKRISYDAVNLNPVWGRDWIAYDHQTLRPNDAPVYQIWLMRPDGTHKTQITQMVVPTLLDGLMPIAWSANGRHLLTSYQGQDTSQTWALVPSTHALRQLTIGGQALDAAGISSDGSRVLVDQGAFQDVPSHGKVETLPFGGGHAKVLISHGADPNWTR
jgi:hypothetical protein